MSNRRWLDCLIVVGLVVLCSAVFGPVRHFEFVDYDDLSVIVDNPHVVGGLTLGNVVWAFVHAYEETGGPLTWMSLQFDAQLFGLAPGAFHLTNLVVHATAACCLFLAFRMVIQSRWVAAWIAAIFAVHPLHVESVAWISERKDVLAGLFVAISLAAYFAYVHAVSARRYLMLLAAFACALMSKPVAVTFPVLLLCVDVWPLQRLSFRREDRTHFWALVREKVPLFVMSGIVSALTIYSQRGIGAMASLSEVSWTDRVQNAVVSLTWYLAKAAWPIHLGPIYPLRVPLPWPMVGCACLVVGILSWRVWRERERRPFIAAGGLWFLIGLTPMLGLLQTGAHARADRNMYLPLIGLSWMAAVWATSRIRSNTRWSLPLAIAGGLVVSAAAWQAHQQVSHWRSSETLFRRALAVTDDNYIAATGLATALRRRGERDEPAALYRAALAATPSYAAARGGLGETLLAMGAFDAAVYELGRAIEIDPNVPEYHVNLGSAFRAIGRPVDSVKSFRRAQALAPNRADIYSGLGAALAEIGDVPAAIAALETATHLDPRSADALFNLGVVLARSGRAHDALAPLQTAATVTPDSVGIQVELAGALMQLGRYAEAAACLRSAVRLDPRNAILRSNLGGVLVASGKYDEAEKELLEALRLAPELQPIHDNLALLRAKRR